MIIGLLILFSLFVSDNPYEISGTIKDYSTEEPLAGANIYIKGTSFGAAADQQGNFACQINNLSGTYTLVASFVGYHDYHREITFPLKEDQKLEIYLKESAIMMDQIVVTGTRSERMLKHSPVTTQVINKKKIQESGATDLSEILDRVTGVSISSNARGAGANTAELQGFGSDHVLVLIDGMKLIGRVEGKLDISQIPAAQIERVEIVKGATSTLYGSEAMGGVINIITKKPDKDFSVNAFTQIGSYGKLDAGVDLGSRFDQWILYSNFNFRRSSGFDFVDSTAIQDGPSFNKYQGGLKLKRSFSELSNIELTTNYFQEEQKSDIDADTENIVDNSNFAGRIAYQNSVLSGLKITSGIEYSNYQHKIVQSALRYYNITPKSDDTENLLKGDVLFDSELDIGDIQQHLNGGYSFEYQDIQTDRLSGDGKKNNRLHNLFVQDEVKYGMINVSPGIRMDIHSDYGTEISPKLAIMLSPLYNLRLRASYGHGFRAPSFKELYIDLNHSQYGYRVNGNPDLKPERSSSYNIGAEFWTANDYHSRISFFYNDITNHIISLPVDTAQNGVVEHSYGNISGAQTWGMEWDMEYYPFHWFEFGMGYYYLGSKDESTGFNLPLSPRHRANLRFVITLPWNIKWSVTNQFVDRKFYYPFSELGDNTRKWVDGYVQIHTNLNYILFENYSLNFGVKNITDYINKSVGPMPGREFYFSIGTNF